MINHIRGLHHITALASDPRRNNAFFTGALGLRRIKKSVNHDVPEAYHLYYGDEQGTAGSVMTYFPYPNIRKGSRGVGEVGGSCFAIPSGSLPFWQSRLNTWSALDEVSVNAFGEKSLTFAGPDGEGFALIETSDDTRIPWTGNGVGSDEAIRGFHSASLRLREVDAVAELLEFMGFEPLDHRNNVTRFAMLGGNEANVIDVEVQSSANIADRGSGSVHHIAFAVDTRAEQLEVRKALTDTGYQVTPVIDRDYFWSIYFRAPGGVLFEVATNEPGFDRDEDVAHLGEALKLPAQHEHLRERLEETLQPIE